MEDSGLDEYSVNEKNKKKKWLVILLIIVLCAAVICTTIFCVLKVKYAFNLDKKYFKLSDSSSIIFYDKNKYMLSYEIMSNNVIMLGEYNMSMDNSISKDILNKYNEYILEFGKDDYRLGYLELNNKELYINGEKEDAGSIDTNYLLMLYYNDGNMEFKGYNVTTGIKIKFKEQKGQFKQVYNSNISYLEQ